jgi:hypothetical protein
MAGSNPNSKENSDPYPRGFDANKVRSEVDPQISGSYEKFEADIAKLDRGAGSEKGGR